MEGLPDIEDSDNYLFLWEINNDIFETYKVVKHYLNEYYSIDSAILLAIIKDKGMSVTKTLSNIPYIHSGYISIISDKAEDDGRSEEQEP